MFFWNCFDTLVLTCDDPIKLSNCKVVKRIKCSRNILATRPVIIVADPFLAVKEDTLYLFYEEYRTRDKGVIKMMSTKDLSTWTAPQVVLQEPFHLSYPWVFQHDGQWWMMPETAAAHAVRLYKAVDDDFTRFEHDKSLLTHAPGDVLPRLDYCDSSIVENDGRFYLFTTINARKGNELHLYSAESYDGHYVEHPQSPVAVGDKYGRNGGALLRHNGHLYRFAQDCDGEYGKEINIFEVMELSPNGYKEELVRENALTGRGLRGGHQYNFVKFNGKWVVTVDQKVRIPYIGNKVKRYFERLKK